MKYIKNPIFLTAIFFMFISSCMSSTSGNGGKDSLAKESAVNSGSDMYYQYNIVSTGKNLHMNGYVKMYLAAAGNVRTEMDMLSAEAGRKKTSPIVLIGNSNKPNESIYIDDDAKTFTVNHIDPDSLALNNPEKIQSSVTKIGEEKILGYNCVHARVISTKSMGGFFKTTDTLDIWKSKDVPLEGFFKKFMDRFESKTGSYMYSPAVVNQLKAMGCEGMMVRLDMTGKDINMKDELKVVEHRDLAKSMFEIPAGYKETKSDY